MKLGFLELMDTSGLSEENKKFFLSLPTERMMKSYPT